MTRRVLLIFITLFLPFAPSISGQKALKNIRSLLKSKKNTGALAAVKKLEADSTFQTNPQIFNYGALANVAINDELNEKIYLKQQFDSVQFFNSIYEIYTYSLKCDSAEQTLPEKKRTFQKQNRERIRTYYRNLVAGGRFYYYKSNYQATINYLQLALNLPGTPLLDNSKDLGVDNSEIATMLVVSAYNLKNYKLVKQFSPQALQKEGESRATILKIMAQTALVGNDTTAYIKFLRQGLEEFPKESFFFTELTDYYTNKEDYPTSLRLADEMLRVDSTNFYFLTAKSLALLNMGKDKEAIEFAEKSLATDSTNCDTHYYIGVAYCNLATNIDLPLNVHSKAYKKALVTKNNYYKLARPHLELYRSCRPEDKERWCPLLYSVYLALNDGEKFSEIEKIMNTVYTPR